MRRYLPTILFTTLALVLLGAFVVLRHYTHGGWFWHPLAEGNNSTCSKTDHSGCGYSFWSGSGSDIGELTLITAALALVYHHNCHVKGCWRLGHADPEHGHPACKHHTTNKHLIGKNPHD